MKERQRELNVMTKSKSSFPLALFLTFATGVQMTVISFLWHDRKPSKQSTEMQHMQRVAPERGYCKTPDVL